MGFYFALDTLADTLASFRPGTIWRKLHLSLSLMTDNDDARSAKMKLFQTLDGSIAAHTDVLKGRAEVLAEAKRSLIENGKTLA